MININEDKLIECLTSPSESFKQYGNATDTPDGLLVHIDRGAKVLGVAHLDNHARGNDKVKVVRRDEDGNVAILKSEALDDRLGVHALLYVLPSLGVECDVLLTEGEERGMSTAVYFKPPRRYNWIFSFDCTSNLNTMYQYATFTYLRMLINYGFLHMYPGTYSDIRDMEHLGVAGFNFGVGYCFAHDKNSYADMSVFSQQIKKFVNFYHDYHNTLLKFIPCPIEYLLYDIDYLTDEDKDERFIDYCSVCKRAILADNFIVHDGEFYCYRDVPYSCRVCGRRMSEDEIPSFGPIRCQTCNSTIEEVGSV